MTHFSIPITGCESQNTDAYVTITLYDATGIPLLIGPVTNFRVVAEDVQTLVLEVTDEANRRELLGDGVVSAAFRDWHSLSLNPGMEVAQVDWDGARARVDWTTVNSVVTGEGTPRLELADGVESGGSGGGVFWQGYHVATNWMLREYLDGASGVVLRQASTAALNSEWWHSMQY